MTLDEAKQHFTKLAQDAGLDAKQTEVVLQAMENEKFRNNLGQGYKRHEEYSRDMDALRSEKERLKNWYENEELPKYNTYVASTEELRQYKQLYGDLNSDPQGLNNGRNGTGSNGNGGGPGMTQEQFDRLFNKAFEEKNRVRDGAFVELMKSGWKAQGDFFRRFNQPLSDQDIDEIEKIAVKNGKQLTDAYKDYIAPKIDAARDALHKKELEDARAEGARDALSRLHLPVDTKPKEAHPFWDRKSVEAGKTELDQDKASREAFYQGWNNYEQGLQKKS
jgi:hypothetical protein